MSEFRERQLCVAGACVLFLSLGCGDDHAVETTSESTTAPEVTVTSGTKGATSGASSTTAGSSTSPVDTTPWQSSWYGLTGEYAINRSIAWANGGDSLWFMQFELRANGATIQTRSCFFGDEKYEYTIGDAEADEVVLVPVGGVHEYSPNGEIEVLFVELGPDCSSLKIRQRDADGVESDIFGGEGIAIERGALCLEKCADNGPSDYGLVTDCGVPVPWSCG